MDEDEELDNEVERAGAILSPEGVIMLLIALFLDLIGFVLTVFGVLAFEIPEIVNWISDGAGLAFFGLWIAFRSPFQQEEGAESTELELTEGVLGRRKEIMKTMEEKRPELEKLGREMKKPMKQEITRVPKTIRKMGRGVRFGIAILGEVAPIIGALPFWTWFVYTELRR